MDITDGGLTTKDTNASPHDSPNLVQTTQFRVEAEETKDNLQFN